MHLQRISLVLLVLGSFGLASCGDDDDNAPAPIPQNEPQQPNSVEPLWNQVETEREVETANTPESCDSPRTFVVQSDGAFLAGPCSRDSGEQPTQGNLTDEERTELNRRMNLMLEAGRGDERVCQEVSIEQDAEVEVTPETGTPYKPMTESTDGRCFRGDIVLISDVNEYLLGLEQTYYPTGAQPSPSPSPTPSPTMPPSPGPSPIPSPTVTVSPLPSPTVTISPLPEETPEPDLTN